MELNKEFIREILRESLNKQKAKILENKSEDTNKVYLYQSTSMENLERIKNAPKFSAEFFGFRGGNLHTRAIYSNLEYSQAAKQNYGNVVLRLTLYGGLKNVLCFNKYYSRKYFGGKNIIEQIEEIPSLNNLLTDSLKKKLNSAFISGNNESGAVLELCNYLSNIEQERRAKKRETDKNIAHKGGAAQRQDFSHAILTRLGIRGCIYYGNFDKLCLIAFNADEVIPTDYIIDPKHNPQAKWQKINIKRDANKIDHIQAFMSQFDDKFEWDRNQRSFLNTILVKSKENGLFYYIDTTTKGFLFDIGFYDARQFDEKTKKAWIQITPEDKGLFIDKKGNLYNKPNGRAFSELYFFCANNDFQNSSATKAQEPNSQNAESEGGDFDNFSFDSADFN